MTPAEHLAAALLSDRPLAELTRVRPLLAADPSLFAVAEAAERLLGPGFGAASAEADALRAVSGHPGLSAAELEELVPGFRSAAAVLLDKALVSATRFERSDCWTRTAAGAALLRTWS